MASGLGRCINFGGCAKADSHAELPMGGPDAICPECGKPLVPMRAASHGIGSKGFIAIVAVLILGVVSFGFMNMFGGHRGTSTAAVSKPVASSTSTSNGRMFLRLCGSNTIGSQLGPDLVKGFLQKNGASQVSMGNGSKPDEQVITASLNSDPVQVSIAAHGSATAFAGLANGSCDIGEASRRVKGSEAGHLRRLGNMVSRANEHVIGLDGIAVIVNPANPIDSLTIDQLRRIFSGEIKSWRGVGGGEGAFTLYARDAKSGTYDTFASLVLGKTPLSGAAHREEDSRELSQRVASDSNAIGFIGLPYIGSAKALKIASGGVAVAPNTLTVGRETYPLTRRLYLYTASNPSEDVKRFIQFAQSDTGQSIVNQDGFVGTVLSRIGHNAAVASVPSGAPPGYASIVKSSDQLPFNFYFQSGSDVLDNKAFVDVGRVVALTSSADNRSRRVILVGFADSTGTHDANQVLSVQRAESVRRELESQGVEVKEATGFGDALPIRDNATEEGRQKNRRVEIFLAR